MAGLQPARNEGRVNGLARPNRFHGRRVRVAQRHPVSLIAAGMGLYLAALAFPLVLRQVNTEILVAAVVGTALLLLGLHSRWTRSPDAAP